MAEVAILSDIHANLEALSAVLRFLEERGISRDRVHNLGDLVGLGPDPVECVDLALGFGSNLRGAFDEFAVLNDFSSWGGAYHARDTVIWTRRVLLKASKRPLPLIRPQTNPRRWELLAGLQDRGRIGSYLAVHGSPRNGWEYILKTDATDAASCVLAREKLETLFSLIDGPCFCGRTHLAGVIDDQLQWHDPEAVGMEWPIADGRKCFINPGSVGAPKGDPRSVVMTFDVEDRRVRWHRVPYDLEATVRRIERIPEFDPWMVERLRSSF